MRITKILEGRVLSATEKYILVYDKGNLIVYANDKKNSIVKKVIVGNWTEKITLLNRLLRKEPRCAVQINDSQFLISYNGKIYNYDIKNNKLVIEHVYEKGMKNPLCFCVEKREDGTINVYYGEYIWNENKGPVAVYKRADSCWEKVFEFKAGLVTHIHNIIFDEKRKCFYILTGDSDEESGIWLANNDFSTVTPLVIGKQEYRACTLFPVEDGVVFATDTPLKENYISKLVIEKGVVSRIQKLISLPGSCIYGGNINGNYYFATTVEPDSSLGKLRYKFTYKLGKGIKDRYSHIIRMSENGSINEIYKSKKDGFPMWLFQFGNFIFPYNTTNNIIVVSQALKCGHSRSFVLGVDRNG